MCLAGTRTRTPVWWSGDSPVNRLGPHPIHPLAHWRPDFYDSQDISDYSRFKMRLNICRSKVWAPEMRRREVRDMKEGQARKSRYRWTGRKTPSADSVSASLVFSRLPCHWKRAGFAFHSWHKMLLDEASAHWWQDKKERSKTLRQQPMATKMT